MTHRHPIRIYFEDTDAGGMVYHAAYLRFAERARTEALREAGVPHARMLREFNLMFVVHRIKIDYLRPARLDDSLEVLTLVHQVRAASVALRQDVHGPHGPCAALTVELACLPPGGTRPARIPRLWRDALETMRAESPAQ